jgi:hypothetical protein
MGNTARCLVSLICSKPVTTLKRVYVVVSCPSVLQICFIEITSQRPPSRFKWVIPAFAVGVKIISVLYRAFPKSVVVHTHTLCATASAQAYYGQK